MIQAPATTAMIDQVLSRSTPATTATAMMNPASIRNREPTTGTGGSYGCCSSCDSFEGAEPSGRASSASAGSSAALGGAGFAALGFAEGGETGGGAASAAAGR